MARKGQGALHSAHVETADGRAQAFALRVKGLSFHKIAREMGISATTAHRYVRQEYEARRPSQETVDEARALDLERLDGLIEALADKANGGDCAAIDRMLRIMESRARLCGLNAPVESKTTVAGDADAPVSVVSLTPEQQAEAVAKAMAVAAAMRAANDAQGDMPSGEDDANPE